MWPFAISPWHLISIKERDAIEEGDAIGRREKRLQACTFITHIGQRLNFPLRTVATAQVYFHLFFATKDRAMGDEYPHMDIALTAILVASKAEETYKKIRQILSAAFLVLNPSFAGGEEGVKIGEEHRLRVTQYERCMLERIDFNFAILHPHQLAQRLLATPEVFLHGRLSEDDREQVSRATQAFLSAAYLTLATITYPSELISLAAIAHALAALAATKGTAARPALAAAFAPYEGILQEIIAYARQESTVL